MRDNTDKNKRYETKMTLTQQEIAIITEAMMKASKATLMVREAGMKDASRSKEDKTPVTIADLASQAILLHEVANIRPADRVHAEEEAENCSWRCPSLGNWWRFF